jgi:hypothetical protein
MITNPKVKTKENKIWNCEAIKHPINTKYFIYMHALWHNVLFLSYEYYLVMTHKLLHYIEIKKSNVKLFFHFNKPPSFRRCHLS